MTPDPGLSFGLFMPLVLAGALYAVLVIAGGVLERRGSEFAETASNAAFLCILAAAAYAVVLAVITFVSKFGVIDDFVYITLVVIGFFAILAGALLLVEMLVGVIGRSRGRDS
ncbi:MAG: hypothetical protein H0U24_02430 [Thermoleophilaceae bacterium]|nr:hypothetical protein [Thermoleophilaceae bacterium]